MAVGPSCFVRRETRGLNERLGKGWIVREFGKVFLFFSLFLSLSLFFFARSLYMWVIISWKNLEEVVERLEGVSPVSEINPCVDDQIIFSLIDFCNFVIMKFFVKVYNYKILNEILRFS